jgi:nucleotide-binding universal stress UspA family protein
MRRASFGEVKSILVPLDFSPVSRLVVSRAVALALPSNASLLILHVVQPPAVLTDYDPVLPVVQTMSRAAVRQLARWKAFVETRGLIATTVCRTGASPSQVIAAEAELHGSDYIVMGSHGHGALYDLFVGSTTGGVLRRVHCPVVVVPALRRATEESPAARGLFEPAAHLIEPRPLAPRQARTRADRTHERLPLFGTERATRPALKYAN